MKKTFSLLFVMLIGLSILSARAETHRAAPVKKTSAKELELLFKNFDCPFLVSLTHTKDKLANPLGYCMYTHTEERGIFASVACVGVLVEPTTQSKNPFYGSRGHWGLEGKCEATAIKNKFVEPLTETTVNPITDIRQKRKDGVVLKKIRDDFGLWEVFEKATRPKKL